MSTPAVRRGEVLPWPSLAMPPEGYRFMPNGRLVGFHTWSGIIALRDHDERPVLDEGYLGRIEKVPDRQASILSPREDQS